MSVLIVTAVDAEARAIGAIEHAQVIVGGIGRVNAAVAVIQAVGTYGPFDAVMSAGVAGILPGNDLVIGDVLVGEVGVYAEEGLEAPVGFQDMAAMGLSLGDFEGNTVPADPDLLARIGDAWPRGLIATVATCSGTDARAREIARRTGALAEAMEGAAVLHASRLAGIAGVEVRAMSNTTGDRQDQVWDLPKACSALATAVRMITSRLG